MDKQTVFIRTTPLSVQRSVDSLNQAFSDCNACTKYNYQGGPKGNVIQLFADVSDMVLLQEKLQEALGCKLKSDGDKSFIISF